MTESEEFMPRMLLHQLGATAQVCAAYYAKALRILLDIKSTKVRYPSLCQVFQEYETKLQLSKFELRQLYLCFFFKSFYSFTEPPQHLPSIEMLLTCF